ncbi:ATP-binding cassette domain-containing protein [Rhodococcus rhodnii]|uniref:ABC-type quaternary amine transporter n=2 Tax=Rhodococcus rhodnii TaxID=38312 RepID=R7WQ02_9NOCA|nr:ATP-binding cassette domain-containing protein [Rhodococcus rhodnii]EOM77378.1 ABC amino acid transporter [Rhodococcus rhodnii LMG 5362]TXG92842.1 ATP-binding cassette domain-containing protein [Rhodococcus rhodnii]
MISFEHATKEFDGGVVAVDDLTLDIPAESFTVFVGPSGGGKTTAMRMINRMVTPTSGTVRVDGRDVAGLDATRLRLGMGYVIQNGGLLPHRTVLDNVATVPVLSGDSRRSARRTALGVLERVGLGASLANRYPAQLSGGQQQRVGVARALAADPPILLMDEPFSAVDPVVREELQTEMRRLQSELRKTIVFVTHDIDEAVTLGDRIAVFGPGGRLRQYDAPDVVLASPADDFVAEFVGRDRGYRGLSFRSASDVPIHEIRTVTTESVGEATLGESGWALVVSDDGRPLGWVDAAGVAKVRGGSAVSAAIAAGGSLFPLGADLRQALDAAISSPSGIGVAVDADGVVRGGVLGTEVLAGLSDQRRSEDATRERTEFGEAER